MLESLALTRIPPEDEALRAPVRAFLDEALRSMPAEQRARSWSGFDPAFSRALGARGWIGLTLPREFGGGGRSAFARFVVVEELLRAGAPVAAHWIGDRQSAPQILRFGTPAQAERYVPAVCRGEIVFCIGMSEPGAGSDLAAVRTRATRSAHGWRLEGQKIWTTNAHRAHVMLTLARTSGDASSRHAGLSQFLVDLSLPGITVRPIRDLNGESHFNEVFFDGVELPDDALLGEEGAGWKQVTSELVSERSGPERIYASIVLFDEWLAWLRARGRAPGERERVLAGRVLSTMTVLRSLSVAVQARIVEGGSPATEAALVKDLGTTFEQFIPEALADVLGEHPDEALPESLAAALRHVAQIAPSFSLRGGTREVLRGMIARGLGLR
ncbi:MAG TPA: acyl-CoA dehydrogenase family protein [Caldimonas sp.]|nr:acyl-CoA dehydrogenase family protein [Caldimonas sp.]